MIPVLYNMEPKGCKKIDLLFKNFKKKEQQLNFDQFKI